MDLQYQDVAGDVGGFVDDFIVAVAAALGLPAADVAVVTVQPGSVVVDWTAATGSEAQAQALAVTAESSDVLAARRPDYGEAGDTLHYQLSDCANCWNYQH